MVSLQRADHSWAFRAAVRRESQAASVSSAPASAPGGEARAFVTTTTDLVGAILPGHSRQRSDLIDTIRTPSAAYIIGSTNTLSRHSATASGPAAQSAVAITLVGQSLRSGGGGRWTTRRSPTTDTV